MTSVELIVRLKRFWNYTSAIRMGPLRTFTGVSHRFKKIRVMPFSLHLICLCVTIIIASYPNCGHEYEVENDRLACYTKAVLPKRTEQALWSHFKLFT